MLLTKLLDYDNNKNMMWLKEIYNILTLKNNWDYKPEPFVWGKIISKQNLFNVLAIIGALILLGLFLYPWNNN